MSFLDTIKRLLETQNKTTECISSVVEKLQENLSTLPPDIINTQMEIPDKGIVYTLDRWNWLSLMIGYLYKKNKLMPTVYYLARKSLGDICTGEIKFFIDKITQSQNIYNRSYIFTRTQGIFSLTQEMYTKWVADFHNRMEGKKFCSLVIGFYSLPKKKYKTFIEVAENLIDGHAIMLFIENKENQLNLYLYDPHGSKNAYYKEEAVTFSLFFKHKYEEQYKKTVNIIPPILFSCPIGIQGVIPEDQMGKEGYCIMYSYFWLYIILHCSNMPNVNLNTLISNIEKSVISVGRDPKTLAHIIYIFAENVVNTANTHMPNKEEYFKDVNKYMLDYAEKEKLPSQPIKPRVSRRNVPEVESGDRKKDGENCETDIKCLSHCCSREGKCTEIDYLGKKFPTCGGPKPRTRPY